MSEKLLLKALQGESTERVPFWFMRQAGRYLPEYRALRKEKGGFLDMVYDPDAACEITIQPLRRFGMDGAILFSDILVIPHALGQHLEFVAGEGPKLHPLENEGDLAKLDLAKIHDTLGPIYQTVSNIRAQIVKEKLDHITTIGFAGAPWTVACYMIEGGGSKDFLKTKSVAYGQPEFFEKLMDILVESTSQYLIKQIEAGAEVVKIFDSWAGVLDHNALQKWVIEPTAKIRAAIHVKHPDIPVIGFPKGVSTLAAEYAYQTKVNGFAFDYQTPPRHIAETIQHGTCVQGNLDPAWLLVGGNALERAALEILENLSDGPFIFNLGHGINKDTPIENVERLCEIIKGYR